MKNSSTGKIDLSGLIKSDKLKNFSEKNREENLEKIRQIMMIGALEQLELESCKENKDSDRVDITDEQKFDFFDV